MPWAVKYKDADRFMKYRGVSFYHVYKDDDYNQRPRRHDFVLSPEGREDDSFNVTKLPGWVECPHPPHLTRENDTPENRELWQQYADNNTEANHIKAFMKRMVDYFLAVADMKVYTYELSWIEHKAITHTFLNDEDARAWWESADIKAKLLDRCEITDLEIMQIEEVK